MTWGHFEQHRQEQEGLEARGASFISLPVPDIPVTRILEIGTTYRVSSDGVAVGETPQVYAQGALSAGRESGPFRAHAGRGWKGSRRNEQAATAAPVRGWRR